MEVLTPYGVGPLIRDRVYQYLDNGKLGSTPPFFATLLTVDDAHIMYR